MKKTFRMLGMIIIVMLMNVNFSACSSDDEDDNNLPIVGTWYTENQYEVGTDWEYTEYAEVTYKKDGTLTGYWKVTFEDGTEEIETDTGRYEVIKDVLRLWWDNDLDDESDGPWTETFSINGNIMTTSENGGSVWTRK